MPTLHIEHEITDLPTWLEAFNRFGDARREAGVTAQRISQPIDDEQYIYVQLDFDDQEKAEGFKGFLETVIWKNPEASPALAGAPRARLLRAVEA